MRAQRVTPSLRRTRTGGPSALRRRRNLPCATRFWPWQPRPCSRRSGLPISRRTGSGGTARSRARRLPGGTLLPRQGCEATAGGRTRPGSSLQPCPSDGRAPRRARPTPAVRHDAAPIWRCWRRRRKAPPLRPRQIRRALPIRAWPTFEQLSYCPPSRDVACPRNLPTIGSLTQRLTRPPPERPRTGDGPTFGAGAPRLPEPLGEVLAHPDGVRDRCERRVHGPDTRKETGVDDIKIVNLVSFAIAVEHGLAGV